MKGRLTNIFLTFACIFNYRKESVGRSTATMAQRAGAYVKRLPCYSSGWLGGMYTL